MNPLKVKVFWSQGVDAPINLPPGKCLMVGTPSVGQFVPSDGTRIVDVGNSMSLTVAEQKTVVCVFGPVRLFVLAVAKRLFRGSAVSYEYKIGHLPNPEDMKRSDMLAAGKAIKVKPSSYEALSEENEPENQFLERGVAGRVYVNTHPHLLDLELASVPLVPLMTDIAYGPFGVITAPFTGEMFLIPAIRGLYYVAHDNGDTYIHVVMEIGWEPPENYSHSNADDHVIRSNTWTLQSTASKYAYANHKLGCYLWGREPEVEPPKEETLAVDDSGDEEAVEEVVKAEIHSQPQPASPAGKKRGRSGSSKARGKSRGRKAVKADKAAFD